MSPGHCHLRDKQILARFRTRRVESHYAPQTVAACRATTAAVDRRSGDHRADGAGPAGARGAQASDCLRTVIMNLPESWRRLVIRERKERNHAGGDEGGRVNQSLQMLASLPGNWMPGRVRAGWTGVSNPMSTNGSVPQRPMSTCISACLFHYRTGTSFCTSNGTRPGIRTLSSYTAVPRRA